jgi:type II secretion system protein C
MSIDKRDIGWMSVVGMSVLSFLNIFVQISSRRTPIINKPAGFISEPGKDNKPLILPSVNINPAKEDKGGAPLPFELRGTIAGNPSLAFIYNSDTDKYAVYKLNDFISGYKILSIRPARVILGKNGALRELLLAGGRREYTQDEQPVIFADASDAKVISRSGFAGLIPQANGLLRKVRILPVADNVSHKLMGFRVDGVPEGSIIEGAGIKSGDIIHSVGGRRLESLQDAMRMLGVIRKQSGFEVVLLRQDKPVILRYEFRN